MQGDLWWDVCSVPTSIPTNRSETGAVGTRFVSSRAVTPVLWAVPALTLHSRELPGSRFAPALIWRVLVIPRQGWGAAPQWPWQAGGLSRRAQGMWSMSAPCSPSLSTAYAHQLHPSPRALSGSSGQLAALTLGAEAPGACGRVLTRGSWSTVCAQDSARARAVQPGTTDRVPLCKSHASTRVCTHTPSARREHVTGRCACRLQARMEGVKAQKACAPAARGWSPVTALSCLLVLSGPTRTASWRIWTRLG